MIVIISCKENQHRKERFWLVRPPLKSEIGIGQEFSNWYMPNLYLTLDELQDVCVS